MVARSNDSFDPAVVAPWHLGAGRRGALLLHGFAGTPPELRRLGEHLAAHGWRCSGPVMAGHGTTPEAMARTRWQDWAASASMALDRLASECDEVVVAGQSMGGAMALHLAAMNPGIRAVATLAAPIWLSDRRLKVIGLAKHFQRWYTPDPNDVDLADPAAVNELYSYGRRSTGSIHELTRLTGAVRRELPMVRQPVLLLHGGGDRTVDPRNASDIAGRLVCSREVEVAIYPRSGHAMSVDVDRDEVNARILAWFDRWMPAEAPASASPAAAGEAIAAPLNG
jgi:carboxylesterase